MVKPHELKQAAAALYEALQLLGGTNVAEVLERPVAAAEDLIGASVRFTVDGVPFWADVREG